MHAIFEALCKTLPQIWRRLTNVKNACQYSCDIRVLVFLDIMYVLSMKMTNIETVKNVFNKKI